MIKLRKTKKFGRGLYATKNIKKGQVVELSPVIPLTGWEHDHLKSTVMNTYVFEWDSDGAALALGFGSLFNHSQDCNVTYDSLLKSKQIKFTATRNIKKGEQLLINYGYEPEYGIAETKKNREKQLMLVNNVSNSNEKRFPLEAI